MKHEEVKPYSAEGTKHDQVEEMFNNIAPTYDRLNHSLAWSIDRYWRRHALRKFCGNMPGGTLTTEGNYILDIATGTGDLAIDACVLTHASHIDATDISEGMMVIGKEKAKTFGFDDRITFRRDDVMALSAEENTYDAVISAYGLRNFPDLRKSFSEMYRVTKSGGRICLVELATPPYPIIRQLFWLYSHTVMPTIGWLLSRDIKAYQYLVRTIEAFPQAETIDEMLREAGFTDVEHHRLTFGICTYFIAHKL